jgi:hypothetical protein
VSDFSGLEQSFVLPALVPVEVPQSLRSGGVATPGTRSRSYDVQLDEVSFRRLHAADEIHAIQKMRAEIQLPGQAVADPGFVSREKKETGKVSSARSNGMTTSSAR